MRKGRRDELKSGDEWDALHRKSVRLLGGMQKAGAKKKIKKRVNKRARKIAKSETKDYE